jgi:hypothetical protein
MFYNVVSSTNEPGKLKEHQLKRTSEAASETPIGSAGPAASGAEVLARTALICQTEFRLAR